MWPSAAGRSGRGEESGSPGQGRAPWNPNGDGTEAPSLPAMLPSPCDCPLLPLPHSLAFQLEAPRQLCLQNVPFPSAPSWKQPQDSASVCAVLSAASLSVVWAVLCAVGHLAASLASTHYITEAPSPSGDNQKCPLGGKLAPV